MPSETLLLAEDGGVATITLNRPAKRNALNARMFDELEAAFEYIAASPKVRAFILTGAGGHFCSGLDLTAFDELPASGEAMAARMRRIERMVTSVVYCPKPGVAAVAGHAAGGGASLAMACDLVIMADDARFSELFVRRGLVIDMSGTFTLPRSVGLHRAKELALLGEPIAAARAYEIGIANQVVPAGDLAKAARELAAKLAAGPQEAMARMKRALNDSFSTPFEGVLRRESTDQTEMFSSPDLDEAIRAFLQDRPPNFSGA